MTQVTPTEPPVCVFGDVHGKSDQLSKLFREVRNSYGDETRFVTVGDLIDRGAGSRGVIDLCIQHKVIGVLGNHDLWFKQLVCQRQFDSFALHAVMGGKATLASYGEMSGNSTVIENNMKTFVPKEHKAFLESLLLVYRFSSGGQQYVVTHAGVSETPIVQILRQAPTLLTPAQALDVLAKLEPASFLWSGPLRQRGMENHAYHFPNEIQLFGHTPVPRVKIEPHFIALDTGCGTCPPHVLSAIMLPDRQVISIPS